MSKSPKNPTGPPPNMTPPKPVPPPPNMPLWSPDYSEHTKRD